jgi:hypothetical protein
MQPLPGRAHRWQHPWLQPNRPTTLPCASSAGLRWPSCAVGPKAWTWSPPGTATSMWTARATRGARAASCSACSNNCASSPASTANPRSPPCCAVTRRPCPRRAPRCPRSRSSPRSSRPTSTAKPSCWRCTRRCLDRLDSRSTARRRQRLRERLVECRPVARTSRRSRPATRRPAAGLARRAHRARLAVVGIRTAGRPHVLDPHQGLPLAPRHPPHRPGGRGAHRALARRAPSHLGALPSPALAPLSQIDTTALTPAPRIGIVPLERFSRRPDATAHRAPTGRRPSDARWPPPTTTRPSTPGCACVWRHHTWRTYRKEAERFLLWAVLGRRKALSSLDGDDCVAYRDFLAHRGPSGPGRANAQRWSEPGGRSKGPLSVRSQALAITIVRAVRVAGAAPLPRLEPVGRCARAARCAVDAAAAGACRRSSGTWCKAGWPTNWRARPPLPCTGCSSC